MDKTILNYSSIFGIQKALHLEGSNYSWLGRFDRSSLLFIFHVLIVLQHLLHWIHDRFSNVVENCSRLAAIRRKVHIWCRVAVVHLDPSYMYDSTDSFSCPAPNRACVLTFVGVCYNFAGIMALRFFLGLLESITGPVFVIVTSNWWTRREQAFRTAFWLGGTPVRERGMRSVYRDMYLAND